MADEAYYNTTNLYRGILLVFYYRRKGALIKSFTVNYNLENKCTELMFGTQRILFYFGKVNENCLPISYQIHR